MPFLCHKNTHVALAENRTVKNDHCPSPVWAAQAQAEEFSANASVQTARWHAHRLLRREAPLTSWVPFLLGSTERVTNSQPGSLDSPLSVSVRTRHVNEVSCSAPFNPERFHSDLGGGRQAQPAGTRAQEVFGGKGGRDCELQGG